MKEGGTNGDGGRDGARNLVTRIGDRNGAGDVAVFDVTAALIENAG